MRDICFIDKTFDASQTSKFHLSVQISPDGLFFAILDILNGKYIVLSGYHLFIKRPRLLLKQIKEIVEKDELIGLDYESIEILYSTKVFTFIPSVFYSKDCGKEYLQFNHSLQKGFLIKENFLQRADSWCIFEMPENLDEYLNEIFPKATIRHNLYPLIEKGLKNNLNFPSRQQVHLNFFRDYFEIVVIKGTKLMQCNTFNYKTERDILYYVLYVFDQLKLSPEDTEVIIHGHLPQVSPVYHLTKKYIRKTSFAKPDGAFHYSYTFNKLPDHYFSSLLNIYKCE